MDERILEFIGDLRRAEVRISPSEALDALAAASEVGLVDRETFKTTLAATLIKEFRDQPTFDRLFDLYFLDLEALGQGLQKALGPADPRVQDMLDRMLAEEGMELDELTELLMRGGGSEMEMAIRASGQNAGLERKIKDALALRQRQEQRGRIDTRRTTRKSLQYGGVPMEIFLKRRHREKPKLVTVCDVSDSVRNASRFMLQLVWSLQECFSRVRSYVFVSEIAEVTQAFSTYPVERAIEWALKGAPVDYHCRSDFGYAFSRFSKTELDSLDRKTTILVLGDARNNYNDPQAWALRLIRERVKGIIWLNPEGQWGWGIGDSVMPMYAPSCDLVRECRTIGQLGEVVDNLVHHWWRRGR